MAERLTAQEWADKTTKRNGRPIPADRIVIPCGPPECDYESCEGWQAADRELVELGVYPSPVEPDVRRRGGDPLPNPEARSDA